MAKSVVQPEFIHKSDVQQLVVAETVAANRHFLDSTRELRRELNDADALVLAMVMAAGGKITVSEKHLLYTSAFELTSYKDEKNRCWVFEVSKPEGDRP